ncbi:methyltransferase type 11 [Neobacillus bataviensis LMG 21833]|uniref:Methyltransferase type 11 n=1 Tax=Neobacillus bataviensis LMG 21833 TaxID=1117379 RepID=K6CHG6_9BACI|nr:class I SAM-dependent methyltransferase [Neobacillus bataviensis]EKN70565.1 methyltransferase type 11 [Neobacillus bataviensis LMG 21833]
MSIFYELHKDIPREGPGNNETTRNAYQLIEKFVSKPSILDIGCGPGMQTIELASLTDGTILATDINDNFLDVLREKVREFGLLDKVNVEKANMKDLPYSEGQFDVIWSEGAIFIIGFEKGLMEWKKYLKENGILVVSELSWLKENAPKKPLEFWQNAYPGVDSIEGNRKKAESLGYEVINTLVLPESGWWDHYYTPLEERVSLYQEKYQHDQEALKTLAEFQTEIDLYRNYAEYYGYVFYLLNKNS